MKEIFKTLSGEQMSRVALGTGMFGGLIDEHSCFALMDRYRSFSGNAIDTGHCYGMFFEGCNQQPLSEREIGKYLKKIDRSQIMLSTKGGFPDLHNMRASRLTRECIERDLSESLDELQTHYIDIYYLHRDDVSVPVSKIMPMLHEWVQSGKIRYLGCSNWSWQRVREANKFALKNGYTPFSFSQNCWNLGAYCDYPKHDGTVVIMSGAEQQAYSSCLKTVQFVAYSPQAYGVFSKAIALGGYEKLNPETYFYFDPVMNAARTGRIKALSERRKVSPASIVFAYILSSPLQPLAVIGCSKIEQLEETMSGIQLTLSEEDRLFLESGD